MGSSSQGTFKILFASKLPLANYSQMVGKAMLNQRLVLLKILIQKMVFSYLLHALIKLKLEWDAEYTQKIQIKTLLYMLVISHHV